MSSASESEASCALSKEFRWILEQESLRALQNVKEILVECSRRFPLHLTLENRGIDNLVKPDKFIISNVFESGQTNIKGMVTLLGDNICDADVNLRIPAVKGQHGAGLMRTIIQPDNCWKLQQLQDAGNFLSKALVEVNRRLDMGGFTSGKEAVSLLNTLISSLNEARMSIVVPKRKTIEELRRSINTKSLNPPLPAEVAVSFYVHATKLVFALYHVSHSSRKLEITDRFQAEVSVPWFSDVIVMFTAALQHCQQLKDKVTVFSQYKDCPGDKLSPHEPASTAEREVILV
ncbi:protein rogdi-like [Watersipora subatra]|uniref:protein rogdi-like n=1 Tax=Watersipora subatra TaxID=2589382 RepID=UPI00355AE588